MKDNVLRNNIRYWLQKLYPEVDGKVRLQYIQAKEVGGMASVWESKRVANCVKEMVEEGEIREEVLTPIINDKPTRTVYLHPTNVMPITTKLANYARGM
jgi:hypothetical protein